MDVPVGHRVSCVQQLQRSRRCWAAHVGTSTQVNSAKTFRAENTDYDSLASPFWPRDSRPLSNEKVCVRKELLRERLCERCVWSRVKAARCIVFFARREKARARARGTIALFRRHIFDEFNSVLCYTARAVTLSSRFECVKHEDVEDATLTACSRKCGALCNVYGKHFE